MVLVAGSHLDTVGAQRTCYGIDFTRCKGEITCDGCRCCASRLKVDGGCHAHRGQELMAVLDDCFTTGNGVLHHAPIRSAAVAENAVQQPKVDLRTARCGGRRWWYRGRQRRAAGRQRLVQPLCELQCVAMTL